MNSGNISNGGFTDWFIGVRAEYMLFGYYGDRIDGEPAVPYDYKYIWSSEEYHYLKDGKQVGDSYFSYIWLDTYGWARLNRDASPSNVNAYDVRVLPMRVF